jgi:PDZ domain-containing secreted protein/Zn-dependent protease
LNSSVRLFRVRGIPVGINWTSLFVIALLFWTLAGSLFPATYPGLSSAAYAVMGAVATVLFFSSILAHELSHTLRALHEGVQVSEITLWLFGGVSKTEGNLPSPGAEFRMVAAGPFSSGLLALVFLGISAVARGTEAPEAVYGVADYLARINGLLAAFNLVPALPLDGGRILHAELWRRSGDRDVATLSAAAAGRVFGWLLVGLGVLSYVTGSDVGGVWFVFLGWYLLAAARQEAFAAQMDLTIRRLHAEQVLGRQPATVRAAVAPRPAAFVVDELTGGFEGAPPREPPPTARRAGGLGIWLVVALAFAVAAAALYHPPYVVISPGDSFDIAGDITVSGVPAQRPAGRYLLTSVRLGQPSALGVLMAVARKDREVLSLTDVAPRDIPPSALDRFERQLYLDSQQMAIAAAATTAGYHATLTGRGAKVLGLARSSPAASVLKVGDVITGVDGQSVTTDTDLRNALRGRPAGQAVKLTVERNGRTLSLSTKTARLSRVSGGTGIGVIVTTRELHVELPFTVKVKVRPDVGGPSAGLAYALAITDMLDKPDDARGRVIAATGTIAADGSVGPVGGVHEKAIAARQAGATVFLVPAEEVSSVKNRRLQVRGVSDLRQAVQVLVSA